MSARTTGTTGATSATSANGTTSAPAPSRARSLRGPLIFLAKVSLASLLVFWLVHSGHLKLAALTSLIANPLLFTANLAAFVTCSVVLATARWRVLLRLADVKLAWGRATALQLMALFFNVVIPGNVGGDVVKTLYVARDQAPEKRTVMLLLVFVERIVGLIGLVFTAGIAAGLSLPKLLPMTALRPLLLVVAALVAGGIIGPLLLLWLLRLLEKKGDRVSSMLSSPSRVRRVLGQLLEGAKLFSKQPRVLAKALLLSMAMHGVAMAYFTLVMRAVVGPSASGVDYGAVATIFPLGLITTVLPISPAGFGVGHVAFDKLCNLIGIQGGATVFNVFIVGQLVPCAIGVIPYLMMRTKAKTLSPSA